MKANSDCIACLLNKQANIIRPFPDEDKKDEYIAKVLKILLDYGQKRPSPWLFMMIEEAYAGYFEPTIDYPAIKKKYNQYMLDMEDAVWDIIKESEDPIASGIKYASAGNFIDFGAMAKVDDSVLEELMKNANDNQLEDEELAAFKNDLEKGKELVYLTDNCGEVVMDKLFIKAIKMLYPDLKIHVIVRSGIALNDANMEDAAFIGLTEIADCIESGVACTGTVPELLSPQAKEILDKADLIISKGQGNFEGMYGENYNTYYLFLCKCQMYVRRFGLKQFTPVFNNEKNIKTKW